MDVRIRFPLWKRFSLLVLMSVFVSVAAVDFFVTRGYDSVLRQHDLTRLGEAAQFKSARITSTVEELLQDVLFLSETPPIQGIIRARMGQGVDPHDGSTESVWRERLSVIFQGMARSHPHYLRLRLIGVADGGREIVRVQQGNTGPVTIDGARLQRKGTESYFGAALAQPPGNTYLSEINLNRENGAIGDERIPVLRAAVPIHTPEGEAFGLLVINLDFREVLRNLVNSLRTGQEIWVSNDSGDLLLHPDSEQGSGFDPGTLHRVQQEFPSLAPAFVAGDTRLEYTGRMDWDGEEIAYHFLKTYYDPRNPARFLGLLVIAPSHRVLAGTQALRGKAAMLSLGIAALFTLIAGVLAHLFSRPLRQVVEAMDDFSMEGSTVALPTTSRDEIGMVSRAFESLCVHLRERDHAIQEGERRFRAFLEAAPNAILVVDEQGKIIFSNTHSEKMFGHTAEELLHQKVEVLIPERFRADHPEKRDAFFAHPHVRDLQEVPGLFGLRKDGTEFPIELSLSPIRMEGKLFAAASVNDITQRRRNEMALHGAMEDLKRSNRELDDFAYIASHDLKEPLRGIHNYSSFLLEDYEDQLDEEGQDKLRTLMRLTQRLEGLIDSLLHYSRVGRTELALGETNLNQVVEEVLDSLHSSLDEAGVEMRIPAPLPTLRCDQARIGEVFRNLISNAAKYSDKEDKWIEVGCMESGDGSHAPDPDPMHPGYNGGPVLYVRDNGIGIPEKHLETVFRMFKRLHGRDKYGGGTGVGLAIVTKIVQQHGGKIWVRSHQGDGTTFYFTLGGK
ncbi:MAG: ATP-binding protein [Leptospirillia bacterium]